MTPTPSPIDAPSARLAWLLAALPPLFWSGNFLIGRAMRDEIPPLQMSLWRWVVAFAFLAPFALRHIGPHLAQLRREAPFLAVLGAIGILAFSSLLYAALHTTTVLNAALINSLMPVATFLFAFAILRQRLTGRQLAGVALAISGAGAVILRGDASRLIGFAPNPGDLLVLAGLTFWALYTVLIRWRPTRLPLPLFLAATVALGIVFHLPLVAWEAAVVGTFALTPATAGTILYFGIFPSVLAYLFWNQAVAALGPGRTGMFMYLMPIFSAGLGWAVLGEPVRAYHGAGLVLIFTGIWLVTRSDVWHA